MNLNSLKKYIPDVLVVLFFVAISFAYFYPADVENRILYHGDASAGRGLNEDSKQYQEQTGEVSRWTNSAFCGMPTYQTSPSYQSTDSVSVAAKAYHLWLPEYVWYVFVYLLGFYILLRAFDFRWHLAALGSIIWAFSSYFLIIIAAGHIWKVMALAYLPPMIGGIILTYRKKYLTGLAITGIFTALEIQANHVQMTYYYMFIIAFLVIGFFVDALRKKEMKHFMKASAACLVGGLLGVAVNSSNLYHTWEYQKESMRGKSELVKANSQNQTSSGLERDYITQWSYGISETWTLLIPNAKGGASLSQRGDGTLINSVSQLPAAKSKATPEFMQIYDYTGQYWGEQPMTSGPVYVGAFVILLFVLGLFIVKGPIKWALLGATVLSILLSWGHNFMWFTDLFIDYMPMYAKFRTVSSILVIAEFTIPLLAMLALKKVIEEPESVKGKLFGGKNVNWLYVSFGLTGGVCLLFWLMPTAFFSQFTTAEESQRFLQMGVPQEMLSAVTSNLKEIRVATFASDCMRSFIIIAICMAALVLYRMKKIPAVATVCFILAVCLFDMWQVDKRYLNDGMFVNHTKRTAPIEPTTTDKAILQDTSKEYRVLNLSSNTFNENETSYFHNSIGGYHPAKLRRYQELIDQYIAKEMQGGMKAIIEANGEMTQVNGDSVMPVLNMLNTKYLILPLQDGSTMPMQNPYAMGNAWFVSEVKYADNANGEIDELGKVNLHNTAVADKEFQNVLGTSQAQDSTSTVVLADYKVNSLQYDVNSAKGGVVVFSEIYYPGWTATVDGQPVEVGRANYVLRAINVPAGKHKVVLEFKPTTVTTTETIAYIALILLILAIIAPVAMKFVRKKD